MRGAYLIKFLLKCHASHAGMAAKLFHSCLGVSDKFDSKKMEFGQKIKIVFSQRFLHHKLPKHRPFKI